MNDNGGLANNVCDEVLCCITVSAMEEIVLTSAGGVLQINDTIVRGPENTDDPETAQETLAYGSAVDGITSLLLSLARHNLLDLKNRHLEAAVRDAVDAAALNLT